MAVEAEAEVAEGGAEAKKKGLPIRLIIIAGAALFVVLLAGAGLYFFVFAGHGASTDAAKAQTAAVPDEFIFNLPSMTVNLNDDGASGDQFLKLTVALEVANEGVMKEIQPRIDKVIDALQVY